MVVPNFFTLYVLSDRIPTGRKSQNTGILGHFGLGRPWRLEKPRAQAENRKAQFPVLGVPKRGGGDYHAIQDGCLQFSYILCFGRPDPHKEEIAKYGDFRPFWPRTDLGTEINTRRRPKAETPNFPVLGVPKREKNVTTLSRMVVRNFFQKSVLAARTPRAGKREIWGF